MSESEQVETTLIDIVQDAAKHAGIEGTPRLERVEVTNEALANVRLHLRSVDMETGQERQE